MMIRKKKSLLAVFLSMALLLVGCSFRYDPPSVEEANVFLAQHQEDINIIVDYLKELDYDSAFVDKDNGEIFYEFEYHKIESKDVKTGIRHLWSSGCEHISIQKEDNTIYFEIWSRTMGDVDCGISCTIDGNGYPKVQFQTECEPIFEGWFYYFADYEEYRANRSKYDEMWR